MTPISGLLRPVPLGAALATLLGVVGCTEVPVAPNLELTDPGLRWTALDVNSHVYGSFRIELPGGVATPITSGPANFPGHSPAGPGTCEDGAWINAQGRRMAGSLSKPHPHCIAVSSALSIVLEPISSCYTEFTCLSFLISVPLGGRAAALAISEAFDGIGVGSDESGAASPTYRTDGYGIVVGYAIDAATLGTTNQRVGTLSIDFEQFDSNEVAYLSLDGTSGCVIDATILTPCLDLIISASYIPLPAPDGVGTPQTVPGFLWLAPASAPYNYLP